MEGEKKPDSLQSENKYMKLVEEELELYRIPKHLDNDLLKREKIYGEKATGLPGKPKPSASME